MSKVEIADFIVMEFILAGAPAEPVVDVLEIGVSFDLFGFLHKGFEYAIKAQQVGQEIEHQGGAAAGEGEYEDHVVTSTPSQL